MSREQSSAKFIPAKRYRVVGRRSAQMARRADCAPQQFRLWALPYFEGALRRWTAPGLEPGGLLRFGPPNALKYLLKQGKPVALLSRLAPESSRRTARTPYALHRHLGPNRQNRGLPPRRQHRSSNFRSAPQNRGSPDRPPRRGEGPHAEARLAR